MTLEKFDSVITVDTKEYELLKAKVMMWEAYDVYRETVLVGDYSRYCDFRDKVKELEKEIERL